MQATYMAHSTDVTEKNLEAGRPGPGKDHQQDLHKGDRVGDGGRETEEWQ